MNNLVNYDIHKTTRQKDKKLLMALGVQEDPEEILISTNELRNAVGIVRKSDLSMIKTIPREEILKAQKQLEERGAEEFEDKGFKPNLAGRGVPVGLEGEK